jgi:hypothetical protein
MVTGQYDDVATRHIKARAVEYSGAGGRGGAAGGCGRLSGGRLDSLNAVSTVL